MLLGTLPLGQSVQLDNGTWAWIDADSLEQWAFSRGMVTPVLVGHRPDNLVGWCDKVKFSKGQALMYGDLDPGLPDARTTARLVRAHSRDGLSPGVKVSRGEKFYSATNRYGEGTLVTFRELSVVWSPAIPAARWLGV